MPLVPRLLAARWPLVALAATLSFIGSRVAAAPAAEPPPPTVELLDPGSEPRAPLRLAPAEGLVQTVEVRQTTSAAVARGGEELPAAVPVPLVLQLTAEVRAVTPRGAIHYVWTIADVRAEAAPDTPRAVLRALRQVVPGLRAAAGEVVVDPRGRVRRVVVRPVAQAGAPLRRALADLEAALWRATAPFPEEAVGVGARWRVTSRLAEAGVAVRQTADYELIRREGRAATTRFELAQALESDTLTDSALPADVTVRVSAFAASGEGERTDRSDRVLPVAGRTHVVSDLALTLTRGDASDAIRTRTATDIDVRSAAGEGTAPAAPVPPDGASPRRRAGAERPAEAP